MQIQDIQYVLQWWLVFFVLGIVFLPFTKNIFSSFVDYGYLFSKVIAIAIISYSLFLLNTLHIIPFSTISIFIVVWVFALINIFIFKKSKKSKKLNYKLLFFEELLFLIGLVIWSWVRAHEPTINGLEKFMDFGFVNSILRGSYLPAKDMWLASQPINYYYFGHFATAILTKLSFLPSFISFNLMIATLFSFTFCLSFSLAMNLIAKEVLTRKSFLGGILTGTIISFGGNLHMIYGLFKSYNVDNPVPFWKLQFLPTSFPNGYWYPNATRFIPFTIHEFPIYSFVVSDLHGHVLDIPFVLLTIALTYTLLMSQIESKKKKSGIKKLTKINLLSFEIFSIFKLSDFQIRIGLIAFLLSVMYMTNAWDGAIYLLLLSIVLVFKNWHLLNGLKLKELESFLVAVIKPILITLVLFLIFTLPFNLYFKPFASGIGILCAPSFLTKIGHIGPILFEASHCQKSPWWQLLTLYGFFYFFVISFLIFLFRLRKKIKIFPEDLFMLALIILSTILIIIPEFIYLKDIYPQHYRANTMFKLVYQSFMMLSLVSGYTIVRIINKTRNIFFYGASFLLLIPILIYPYYAIKSYYGDLKNYQGLNGVNYLKTRYPDDAIAITWINTNISGQPVMLEAQGDSYTDFERVSSNTGLPTILGWTVHEWLWHGTYDVPAPRIQNVKDIYENPDMEVTNNLLKKFKVQYVYIGDMEHQKYPALVESKFEKLGKVVFQIGNTKIYKLDISY